jgi:lipopolysaccharide export system protein LptA
MEVLSGMSLQRTLTFGLHVLNCLVASIAIFIPPTTASPPIGSSNLPSSGATSSPLNRGLVTIESDVQQGDNQTGVVTATGNVKITYPERGMVATSRQAQYFSKEGRLILSGDVDVIDSQGQRIRAERLTYNLDQERILAQPTPGQQVKSRIRLTIPQSSMGDLPNP